MEEGGMYRWGDRAREQRDGYAGYGWQYLKWRLAS
jgi:hypothetical protein